VFCPESRERELNSRWSHENETILAGAQDNTTFEDKREWRVCNRRHPRPDGGEGETRKLSAAEEDKVGISGEGKNITLWERRWGAKAPSALGGQRKTGRFPAWREERGVVQKEKG